MPEIWKPILQSLPKIEDDYYDLTNNTGYEASNYGRIRKSYINYKGKKSYRILKGSQLKSGYRHHLLYSNNGSRFYYTHELILQTFRPTDDDEQEVNHTDLNKDNNNLTNLEWTTHTENMIHCVKNKYTGFCLTSSHVSRLKQKANKEFKGYPQLIFILQSINDTGNLTSHLLTDIHNKTGISLRALQKAASHETYNLLKKEDFI